MEDVRDCVITHSALTSAVARVTRPLEMMESLVQASVQTALYNIVNPVCVRIGQESW